MFEVGGPVPVFKELRRSSKEFIGLLTGGNQFEDDIFGIGS
jgi:hypothetical protein